MAGCYLHTHRCRKPCSGGRGQEQPRLTLPARAGPAWLAAGPPRLQVRGFLPSGSAVPTWGSLQGLSRGPGGDPGPRTPPEPVAEAGEGGKAEAANAGEHSTRRSPYRRPPAAATRQEFASPGSRERVPEGSLPASSPRAPLPEGRTHTQNQLGRRGRASATPTTARRPWSRIPRSRAGPGRSAPTPAAQRRHEPGPWGPRGGESPQLTARRQPVRDQPDPAPGPRGATRNPRRAGRDPRSPGRRLSAGVGARRLGWCELGPRSAPALGVLRPAGTAAAGRGGGGANGAENSGSPRPRPEAGPLFRGGARSGGVV